MKVRVANKRYTKFNKNERCSKKTDHLGATLKFEVAQLEAVSATELVEAVAPFSRLQSRKNFFTPDVVNDSLLRFFATNGVFSQCGLSRPSVKSLILWDGGGSISEDAILDNCFGDYVCPRRSRCLAAKNPSVSPRFIAKLIQVNLFVLFSFQKDECPNVRLRHTKRASAAKRYTCEWKAFQLRTRAALREAGTARFDSVVELMDLS